MDARDPYDVLLSEAIGWPIETRPKSDREILTDLYARLRQGRLAVERARAEKPPGYVRKP